MQTMLKTKSTKKENISKAAAKLFKEKGFKATTMRDIALQVGIEAGSMYNHIRSKDEILNDLCFNSATLLLEQLTYIETQPLSTIEKLEEIITFNVQLAIEQTDAVSLLQQEWKHLKPKQKQKFKLLRDAYEDKIANIIQKGITQKELKKMNPSVALYTYLSALRWVDQWYKPSRNIDAATLKNEIIALLINGLKA